MSGIKGKILATTAVAVLTCLPLAPAQAFGPAVALPWLVGRHIIGAIAAIATISAAAQTQGPPFAPYSQAPGYNAPAGDYYAPPGYYPPPPAYYPPPAAYYPQGPADYSSARARYPAQWGYSRPPMYYGAQIQRSYAPARRFYEPSARYYGAYGAYSSGHYSRGYAYRRR